MLKWKSEFGSEDFNFPFHFANKIPSSNEEEKATTRNNNTDNTLKLLGFSDNLVNGWKVTPLHTPVVSDLCVCMHLRGGSKHCLLYTPVVSNIVCDCVCACVCVLVCVYVWVKKYPCKLHISFYFAFHSI